MCANKLVIVGLGILATGIYRGVSADGTSWRVDLRCGWPNMSTDGESNATCNPNSDAPCCSQFQWCGGSKDHCLCATCIDYRSMPWREDGFCGPSFPADDEHPVGECNPISNRPCCIHDRCATSLECAIAPHSSYIDYSLPYRYDNLCGPKYPAPDGSGVGQCRGNSDRPCCGVNGVCGNSASGSCACPSCVDYGQFDYEVLSCGGYTWYLGYDKYLHRVGSGCSVGTEKCYSCDTINLDGLGIEGLTGGVFSHMATYYLSVQYNNITHLPTNLFAESEISIISFAENQITKIEDNTFVGWINPQSLHLGHNQITALSRNSLVGLQDMKHLRIDNNNLTTVAMGTFSDLTHLQSLFLNENSITRISKGGFSGLASLNQLDLTGQLLVAECCSILFAVEDLMEADKDGLSFDDVCVWRDIGIKPQELDHSVTLERMFTDIPSHIEPMPSANATTLINTVDLLGVLFLQLFPLCAYCRLHTTYKVDNAVFIDVPLQDCTFTTDECIAIAGHTMKCPPVHVAIAEDITSTCEEMGNSYVCGCADGYEHVNGECADIDECQTNYHDCNDANCDNLPGTFKCSCDTGAYLVGKNTCLPCTLWDERCISCNARTCLICQESFLPNQEGVCVEIAYETSIPGSSTGGQMGQATINPGITAAVIVVSVVVISTVLLALFLCLYRKKRVHYERQLIEIKKKAHWVEGDTDEAHLLFEAVQTIDGWIERDQFVSLEKIGSGNFGDVFRGVIFHNKLATMCAIKKMRSSGIAGDAQEFLNEAQLLRSLNHLNICKMLAVCDHNNALFLLMEHCDEGDLHNYMTKNPHKMTLTAKCWFSKEIAKGMEYLAANKIVHRDVAARNILLSSASTAQGKNNQLPKPKISDFGLARRTTSEHMYVKQSHDGVLPIRWMARETVLSRVYTEKSDVWSYGVALWEIFTLGQIPYSEFKSHELVVVMAQSRVRLPRPTAECPDEMFDLMLSCWEEDPAQRPTFQAMILPLDALYRSAKATSSIASRLNETHMSIQSASVAMATEEGQYKNKNLWWRLLGLVGFESKETLGLRHSIMGPDSTSDDACNITTFSTHTAETTLADIKGKRHSKTMHALIGEVSHKPPPHTHTHTHTNTPPSRKTGTHTPRHTDRCSASPCSLTSSIASPRWEVVDRHTMHHIPSDSHNHNHNTQVRGSGTFWSPQSTSRRAGLRSASMQNPSPIVLHPDSYSNDGMGAPPRQRNSLDTGDQQGYLGRTSRFHGNRSFDGHPQPNPQTSPSHGVVTRQHACVQRYCSQPPRMGPAGPRLDSDSESFTHHVYPNILDAHVHAQHRVYPNILDTQTAATKYTNTNHQQQQQQQHRCQPDGACTPTHRHTPSESISEYKAMSEVSLPRDTDEYIDLRGSPTSHR